jgi:uncharacterized protein Smg (DUF494 family)
MKIDFWKALIHFFENYVCDESLNWLEGIDASNVQKKMANDGFFPGEVEQAFKWWNELTRLVKSKPKSKRRSFQRSRTIRIYSPVEKIRLTKGARQLLFFLEREDFINTIKREIIINRCLALEFSEINEMQLSWVTFVVLTIFSKKTDFQTRLLQALLFDSTDRIKN